MSTTGLWLYIRRVEILFAILGLAFLALGIREAAVDGTINLLRLIDGYFGLGISALGIALGTHLAKRFKRVR